MNVINIPQKMSLSGYAAVGVSVLEVDVLAESLPNEARLDKSSK